MIRATVGRVGRKLECMIDKNLSMEGAFRVLERQARSVEEIVVVEVMRETYGELCAQRLAS